MFSDQLYNGTKVHTGNGSHHQLLVSWVPGVRLRIPRLKSVSGREGGLRRLDRHASFTLVALRDYSCCRGLLDVISWLDGLQRFLLGN